MAINCMNINAPSFEKLKYLNLFIILDIVVIEGLRKQKGDDCGLNEDSNHFLGICEGGLECVRSTFDSYGRCQTPGGTSM